MLRITLLVSLAFGCGHSHPAAAPANTTPATASSGSGSAAAEVPDCGGGGTCIALCPPNDDACTKKCDAEEAERAKNCK